MTFTSAEALLLLVPLSHEEKESPNSCSNCSTESKLPAEIYSRSLIPSSSLAKRCKEMTKANAENNGEKRVGGERKKRAEQEAVFHGGREEEREEVVLTSRQVH